MIDKTSVLKRVNQLFGDAIQLQPFNRILSGFDKLTEVAVSVADCSKIAEKYHYLGITGYKIDDFSGNCFINRYLPCEFYRVPMLIYRSRYLIPLVFRHSPESYILFQESYRFPSFIQLLDWELQYNRKRVIIDSMKNKYSYAESELFVIDAGYLAFRLAEIIDVASFPVSKMTSFDEFLIWNRESHLLDNGHKGRHSMILDIENDRERTELQLVLAIIQKKYPDKQLFSLPAKNSVD
jgi:hypothetical protein